MTTATYSNMDYKEMLKMAQDMGTWGDPVHAIMLPLLEVIEDDNVRLNCMCIFYMMLKDLDQQDKVMVLKEYLRCV